MHLRDLTGEEFGRWIVLKRAPSRASVGGQRRTYWLCRCTCGEVREVLALQLTSGGTVSCGCYRSELLGGLSHDRRRDDIRYYSAHRRVVRQRGSAKSHRCVDCTETAVDWSYDHTDPDALADDRGRPYSVKPEHYSPRCRPCHRAFDKEARLIHA